MKCIIHQVLLYQTIVTSNQITTTMSEFAIYIPCVYKNITEEMIAQTFYRKKIGSVRHVDLVPHNEKYNRAHVFFESMYPFGQGAAQMEQIANGETVKLQYSRNQHVFWVLMKNNRKYDGGSKKGWYDPEQDNKKETEQKEIGRYVQALQTTQSDVTTPQWDDYIEPDMEPNMEPVKKSRNSIMPIHDKYEVDNLEMEEGDDAFGLVSVDYAKSLESELARVRMQRDEALYNKLPMTPFEEHLMDLRRENLNMRNRYDELSRVKLLPVDDGNSSILCQFSDYEGSSQEYYEMVCREIDRFRKDNEALNQNINVLSCMPNSNAIRPSNPVFDQLHRPPSPITTPPGVGPNIYGFGPDDPDEDMETTNNDVSIPECDFPMT